MRYPCLLLLAATAFAADPVVVPAGPDRVTIPLDADWHFHRGDLADPVPAVAIATWRWREGGEHDTALAQPGVDDAAWAVAADGEDTFHGRIGFAWYRTVIPAGAGPVRAISFNHVDDTAEVWLNGVNLGTHAGWNEAFTLPVGTAWHATGDNLIAVRVGNNQGPGDIRGALVELDLAPAALPPPARPCRPPMTRPLGGWWTCPMTSWSKAR